MTIQSQVVPKSSPSKALDPQAGSSDGQDSDLVVYDSVRKSYDGRHLIVKDLNLKVGRGEFLTLLGPSGSGKTTTLMMLAGFERPTSGHILLDGAPVEALPPEKRNIGMVFQNYALFPHMTVAQNVAFPLRYRGIKGAAAAERVDTALAMVRLDGLGERKPSQLSGGQQQRVALARALVFEPRLVLMDEPLGALDKQLRERMQFEIKHLQSQLGLTIVYVTHDQSEALTMSDRVAVFHDGRIQQLATPVELYDRPANVFVADFIGENNLVPVRVEAAHGSLVEAVAADGTRLQAQAASTDRSGKTVMAIRPERVRFASSQGNMQTSNTFAGTIRGIFFQGDHVRYQVAALGVDTLTMKAPPAASGHPAAGDTVQLCCDVGNCLILGE